VLAAHASTPPGLRRLSQGTPARRPR